MDSKSKWIEFGRLLSIRDVVGRVLLSFFLINLLLKTKS